MTIKTVATNRKAYHNYFIDDVIEAGIALTGTEIKSIRSGRVSLGDAYVKPEGGELWLVNAHFARYESAGRASHDPLRARKLLLHSKEIKTLTAKLKEKGLALVAVKVYIKGGMAKVGIALARGKKQYDKREAIAKRDTERELDRAVKNRQTSRYK